MAATHRLCNEKPNNQIEHEILPKATPRSIPYGYLMDVSCSQLAMLHCVQALSNTMHSCVVPMPTTECRGETLERHTCRSRTYFLRSIS
jgi:hypothetical protein